METDFVYETLKDTRSVGKFYSSTLHNTPASLIMYIYVDPRNHVRVLSSRVLQQNISNTIHDYHKHPVKNVGKHTHLSRSYTSSLFKVAIH